MDILDRLETAPYGAFAIDLDQNIVFWNARAGRILGYEPEQVLGRKCYEVLQGLSLGGTTPFCTRDCPAMAAARTGHIPSATQARMQCSSGEKAGNGDPPGRPGRPRPDHAHPHVPRNSRPRTQPGQPATLPLTPREHEILSMLAQGMKPSDVAASLSISVHTVRKHISNAAEKLHSHGAMSAVLAAQRQHLI